MNTPDFFALSLPRYDESSCTPIISDEFRGLKIVMPDIIQLDSHGVVPICGVYRIGSAIKSQIVGHLIENTVVVFVEKESGKPFSFNLVPDKEPVAENGEKKSAQKVNKKPGLVMMEDYIVTNFFNVDALMFYPEFPEKEARYIVYAMQGEIKSNSLEVLIKP